MIRPARLFVCCVLLGIWSGSIHAQPDDKKREGPRAEAENPGGEKQAQRQDIERTISAIMRQITELRAANKLDEAAELERDLKAMIVKMRGETVRGSQDLIRQQIEELRKAGRNDEAAKVELQLRDTLEGEKKARASAEEQEHRSREARERSERREREGEPRSAAGPDDLERRIHHLRVAAENLAAAGLQEQAAQLRRQAEMMQSRFGENAERRPELQELHNQLRQQNERIERLEQMVRKLAEYIERQGDSDQNKKE